MKISNRPVSEIMQTEVATLSPTERLDLADDIMKLGRVRHMPVVEDDGRLVGVVSARDLLAASLSAAIDFEKTNRRTFLRSVNVDEVMARDPLTTEPDQTLGVAAQRMLARKIGCLPVIKPDGTLVGLLTETDLLQAAYLDN